MEPREFRFGAMTLHLVPIPTYLQPWLSLRGTAQHLVLVGDSTVCDWADGRLSAAAEADLRRLFATVAATAAWAVYYEADSGDADIRVLEGGPMFEVLDAAIRGRITGVISSA